MRRSRFYFEATEQSIRKVLELRAHGLSQTQIAERLGTGPSAISRILKAQGFPGRVKLT